MPSGDPVKLLLEALGRIRVARAEVRRGLARLRSRRGLPGTEEAILLLETLDILLEIVSIRLQVVLSAKLYSRDYLALPLALLGEIERRSAILPPQLAEALSSIEETLIAAATGMGPPTRELVPEPVRLEARSIIEKAEEEAKKRLEALES